MLLALRWTNSTTVLLVMVLVSSDLFFEDFGRYLDVTSISLFPNFRILILRPNFQYESQFFSFIRSLFHVSGSDLIKFRHVKRNTITFFTYFLKFCSSINSFIEHCSVSVFVVAGSIASWAKS